MANSLVGKIKRIVSKEARTATRAMLDLSSNSSADGLNIDAIFGKAEHIVKERPH